METYVGKNLVSLFTPSTVTTYRHGDHRPRQLRRTALRRPDRQEECVGGVSEHSRVRQGRRPVRVAGRIWVQLVCPARQPIKPWVLSMFPPADGPW